MNLDRRNKGLFDVLEERKEPALTMAKELWQEARLQYAAATILGFP